MPVLHPVAAPPVRALPWREVMKVAAVKILAGDMARMLREDVETLRAATGLDDRGVLQITLIASFFNYVSRVADALGVGREG